MISQIHCPDPACNTQLTIDTDVLLAGGNFSCKHCNALIGLATESSIVLKNAVENFEKLNTRKG